MPVGAEQKPGAKAPTFTVDPTWPQEFPNHWIMGSVTGVYVDNRDHVWITHLPETLTEEELYEEQKPPMGTCCKAAPVVIELDQNGKVVQGWGAGDKDNPADWPRNPGFSRIRTRRTASSAVMASPARMRKGRTAS